MKWRLILAGCELNPDHSKIHILKTLMCFDTPIREELQVFSLSKKVVVCFVHVGKMDNPEVTDLISHPFVFRGK